MEANAVSIDQPVSLSSLQWAEFSCSDVRYVRFSGVDTDIVEIVVDVKGEEFKWKNKRKKRHKSQAAAQLKDM